MRLLILIIKLVLATSSQAGWRENTVAAVLMAEAGIDGQIGMECVAEVILNRAKLQNVNPVTLVNSNVFASLKNTTPTRVYLRFVRENPKLVETALSVAENALKRPDSIPRRVHGATHFCQSWRSPWWAKDMNKVAIVGRHAFYKE